VQGLTILSYASSIFHAPPSISNSCSSSRKKNIEISWGFQLNGWLMDLAASIIEGLAAADTNPGCRSLVSAGHNKAPQHSLLPEFIMPAAPEIIERLLS